MNWPYVFGQSGTASPESVLVTIPPAAMSSTVEAATNVAKRCNQINGLPESIGACRRGFEGERELLRFLLTERDGLCLRAELLVPRLDRVRARGNILQREASLARGHGEVRM